MGDVMAGLPGLIALLILAAYGLIRLSSDICWLFVGSKSWLPLIAALLVTLAIAAWAYFIYRGAFPSSWPWN